MNPRDSEFSPDDYRPIVQAIRQAGNYVRPSDDLRPRIIEAAKDQRGQQRVRRTASGMMLAFGLLILVTTPSMKLIADRLERSQAPTSDEMQQQATQYSSQSGVGPNWGLTEAFTRLREMQAERFGRLQATTQQ